jgi:hypothetical protein
MIRKVILVSIFSAFACTAIGATKLYQTTVVQTSLSAAVAGGCKVKLAKAPSDHGLICDGYWVHFSCNGAFNSQTEGYQKFQAAQLGLISGTPVKIKVDDDNEKKVNGVCYSGRIDNLP